MTTYSPTKLEQDNVYDIYDSISDHFSDTRISVWDGVKDFLDKQSVLSQGFEIGCGNGKNMRYAEKLGHTISGIDTCRQFVIMCKSKYNLDVNIGNAVIQTFVDCIFDYVISIAVFHHISTNEMRTKALLNMINVLRSNGKGLFSVWAYEQDQFSNKKFKIGDNLVDWNKPYFVDGVRHFKKYHRYYYVYDEEMFKSYIYQFNKLIKIDKIYNQKGNWFCEFTKL